MLRTREPLEPLSGDLSRSGQVEPTSVALCICGPLGQGDYTDQDKSYSTGGGEEKNKLGVGEGSYSVLMNDQKTGY
ncbi:hypothetical protein Bpfe_024425 [Biomphalaria pfeifferi]|uniref:Uncharacterized protein n=1 Tax=Biomphalaria pfeifferi TaxID=112525 RepID=A0AAD8B137_BIOPF|nr:hypothetical protein Bpfe_024425 [Biomphalaria pfeifferi]